MKTTKISLLFSALLSCFVLSGCSFAAKGYTTATNRVKSQMCGATTVDRYMDRKFRHRSSRWHTFANKTGGYDVERVVKISKFADLRYRWHVGGGLTRPTSSRAKALCSR